MVPSVVPVLSLVVVFVFMFVVRVPLRPRRRDGAAGVAGSAEVAGVSVAAGIAGSAGIAGVAAARERRCRARPDAPVGMKEQTWDAPGTVVKVKRSPDFFARIETIVGGGPAGFPGVAITTSPNCIATAV